MVPADDPKRAGRGGGDELRPLRVAIDCESWDMSPRAKFAAGEADLESVRRCALWACCDCGLSLSSKSRPSPFKADPGPVRAFAYI